MGRQNTTILNSKAGLMRETHADLSSNIFTKNLVDKQKTRIVSAIFINHKLTVTRKIRKLHSPLVQLFSVLEFFFPRHSGTYTSPPQFTFKIFKITPPRATNL